VTSAFIIQVQPQLQPDPNDETAALLRVLIHKIDNTTFGDDIPAVPQWSGPPRTIVQVQAILYASLAASLFSAFLAMLGKQWLNRYASIDVRGSSIERGQNRQRKFDGLVTWYFDRVMESLPLMLQYALLLLGCALSRYLWDIHMTVASVVLGATLFGVVFYVFVVIAGISSVNCPYQTPSAHILRYICHSLPLILSVLHSASSSMAKSSKFIIILIDYWDILSTELHDPSALGIAMVLLVTPVMLIRLLIYLAIDTSLLMQEIVRMFAAIACRMYAWSRGACGSNPQAAVSDLQCISWMVEMSLDRAVHLSALKLLTTITTLADYDPTLASACSDILIGCMSIVSGGVVINQGLEELAEVSTQCCLRILSHLAAVDPTLGVLKDARKRYTRAFPSKMHFEGLPADHSLIAIHNIFHSSLPKIQWMDYKLPGNDQTTLAHTLSKLALHRTLGSFREKKVPRWILRFALHHLSQDPLPPTPIVIDCMLIIAIELGHTALDITTQDERCVHILQIFTFLTKD